MNYTYEVYEDNAGGLHLFALDGEQNVVWGFYYYGEESMAAADWIGLISQEIDPVVSGWETPENIDIAQDYKYCYKHNVQIASSEDVQSWEDILTLGIYKNALDNAGREFAIECGVFYRCPECGEVGECVIDRWSYGTLRKPERCGCCDASLEQ